MFCIKLESEAPRAAPLQLVDFVNGQVFGGSICVKACQKARGFFGTAKITLV
jgi:hypothetical protein